MSPPHTDPPASHHHQEDLEIALAILRQDEAVATAFFEANHQKLFHFVLSRCGDHHDATEITQETWVAAIQNLQSYQGSSSLLTWICGIARNKISNHLRSGRRVLRQARIEEFEQSLDMLFQEGAIKGTLGGEPVSTDRAGVLEMLQEREVAEVVGATLALLQDDYQQALRMKYLDGRSIREIAAEIGRGEKAAESLLNRARAAFRDLWRVKTGDVISVRRAKPPPKAPEA